MNYCIKIRWLVSLTVSIEEIKEILSCLVFSNNSRKRGIKMDENKMQLINKMFNNETIRTIWDKEDEKYYISIVDIVGVLAESKNPIVYWRA